MVWVVWVLQALAGAATGLNLTDLLGTGGGLNLNASELGILGGENINLRALTPNEVAGLTAAGFTGFENVEVIDRAGEIIGINTPASGAFAIPNMPVTLPGVGVLPALPAGIPRVGILGL